MTDSAESPLEPPEETPPTTKRKLVMRRRIATPVEIDCNAEKARIYRESRELDKMHRFAVNYGAGPAAIGAIVITEEYMRDMGDNARAYVNEIRRRRIEEEDGTYSAPMSPAQQRAVFNTSDNRAPTHEIMRGDNARRDGESLIDYVARVAPEFRLVRRTTVPDLQSSFQNTPTGPHTQLIRQICFGGPLNHRHPPHAFTEPNVEYGREMIPEFDYHIDAQTHNISQIGQTVQRVVVRPAQHFRYVRRVIRLGEMMHAIYVLDGMREDEMMIEVYNFIQQYAGA